MDHREVPLPCCFENAHHAAQQDTVLAQVRPVLAASEATYLHRPQLVGCLWGGGAREPTRVLGAQTRSLSPRHQVDNEL